MGSNLLGLSEKLRSRLLPAQDAFYERAARRMDRDTLNLIKECNELIEKLLDPNATSDAVGKGLSKLSEALQLAYEKWRDMLVLRPVHEQAEVVLGAFMKSHKINDLLRDTEAFAGQIDEEMSPAVAQAMGYNNYIFFMKRYADDMHRNYKKMEEKIAEAQEVERNVGTVADFIRSECAAIAAIKDIPKAMEYARQLAQLDKGTDLSSLDEKKISEIADARDLLEQARYDPTCTKTIEQLRAVEANISSRMDAMDRDIKKARRLYELAQSVMTDSWFAAFDPKAEGSPLPEMDAEQIRAFYQQRIGGLREKIDAIL